MNLFILDSIDINTFGGYQNWINLTAPALAKRGHKVTIAGRPHSEYLRRFKVTGDSVRVFEIEISGDFNPLTIVKLKKQFEKERTDIVICDFNKDVRLAGLAACLQKEIKVVWHLGLNITKNSFVHKFLTPKLIDAAVVPSENLKKQIVASGYIDEDIVKVIPHGIPDTIFKLSREEAAEELRKKYHINQDNLVVVTSGRFVEQKGHIYLIDAAVGIVKDFPNITFLLLGDGPLESKLKSRITDSNLTEHFIFAGMLDNFDLELAGSDLMIHPSIEEPFGFSVLEGMRAGLPIVASRIGGIPEFAIDGKTAKLIESKNPKALSKAVIDFMNNPTEMVHYGTAGRKRWQEGFHLDTMVDRWDNYLKELLKPVN